MTLCATARPTTAARRHGFWFVLPAVHRRIAVIRTTFQRFKIARSVLLSTLLTGILLSLVEVLGASGGSGTFALTGSLNTARYDHTATLLPSGDVLVLGAWVSMATIHRSPVLSCMTPKRQMDRYGQHVSWPYCFHRDPACQRTGFGGRRLGLSDKVLRNR